MLRIAICDDDKILVTQIEEMLNRYLDKKMIDRYIEIFYDGASLERIYEKGDRFDIIYLDIEMSGKNGIEAAKSIRRLDIGTNRNKKRKCNIRKTNFLISGANICKRNCHVK